MLCYHEDVDQVAAGGVPDLQRQVVGGCDHRAVVAVPRYHGNFQLCHLVFQRRRVVFPGKVRKISKYIITNVLWM